MKMLSLKPMSVVWSCGLSAARNRRTEFFTCGIASVMLPLMSTQTVISSGMFSEAKLTIFCGTSFSKTRKSSRLRPRMYWPCSSVTDAVIWTTSTFTVSV